ncbi:MAG: N-6 DNA methylase [Gammaproteobacteria bacterium]
MPSARELSNLYKQAHNIMRNIDGLQPQEAFDELLKYLYFKQKHELLQTDRKKITVRDIRKSFAKYLGQANSWSSEIWRERLIYLSDECLGDIHSLLDPVEFSTVDLDVRSHALRQFLTPDIRKGLGIYLTPEDVVSAIVRYVQPASNASVLDPACGSGTFLIEVAKYLSSKKILIHGIDKNPRMLLLADLNLSDNPSVVFKKSLSDSLKTESFSEQFDLILTNPPFGVTLDARDYSDSCFKTFEDQEGYSLKKQSSEIVFIERCFQKLKPGGTLAIVIPRSIATNNRLAQARQALSGYGYIYAIISLPPETFSTAGTQTTTIVLFARKYATEREPNEPIALVFANVKNVGFDSTGREIQGNELDSLPDQMREAANTGRDKKCVSVLAINKKSETFAGLDKIFIGPKKNIMGVSLAKLCEYIGTGKTPARSSYSDAGGFLVKVGNLTGSGINWEARDRNYVAIAEMKKRMKAKKPLLLRKGDILLTSSAHNSVYIAKKSDIFCGIPEFVMSNEVSFVGEVMLVRPNADLISSYALLAFLREAATVRQIQDMVRGQTAHLHASDLSELRVPEEVFSKKGKYSRAAELLKKQAELSVEMNYLLAEQHAILNGSQSVAIG